MKTNISIAVFSAFALFSFCAPASGHLLPSVSKFVQRDPKGYVDGLALNQYVRANPVSVRDPTGTCYSPDCSTCWQSCASPEFQALMTGNPPLEGATICRADGCVCACINETRHPPTSDPGQSAIRDCLIAHEECHVSQPNGNCDGPKPRIRQPPVGQGIRRECECLNKELQCLDRKKRALGWNPNHSPPNPPNPDIDEIDQWAWDILRTWNRPPYNCDLSWEPPPPSTRPSTLPQH
jgi:hypothetical protein